MSIYGDFVKLLGENLLLNSDFSINQRKLGVSSGTAYAANTYVTDRWYLYGGPFASNPYVYLNSGNLRVEMLANDTTSYGVAQKVENYTDFADAVVTFSARIKSNCPVFLSVGDQTSSSQQAHPGDGAWHNLTVTDVVSSSPNCLWAMIQRVSPSSGDYFEVEWVKLEVGGIPTTYRYPDPTVEMTRCRRYYYRYESLVNGNSSLANGVVYAPGDFRFDFRFPIRMRGNPTGSYLFTGSGNSFTIQVGTNSYSANSATIWQANPEGCMLYCTVPSNNMPSGYAGWSYFVNLGDYLAFDAEM